ncbi:MAG: hypothetical protein AAGA77_07615 [Bacteroidota bacterium]
MNKKWTSTRLLPFANAFIALSLLYYWIETSAVINPIAIILAGIFALHFFVARGFYRMIFPSIFIVLNLYMFLALFSEFSEFSTLDKNALTLLSVGIIYLGLNLISAAIILHHNITSQIVTVET